MTEVNSNSFARITTAAIGAAGVVGAHALAYRLAHATPAGHDRALESAGHGYWDLAVLLALACLIIGIGVEMVFGGRQAQLPGHVTAWREDGLLRFGRTAAQDGPGPVAG